LLVILIDFSLSNWNESINLIDSAFIIFRVISFKWRHIVWGLILRSFYLHSMIAWVSLKVFGQKIQLFG
jgi:hypothetical protein